MVLKVSFHYIFVVTNHIQIKHGRV